MMQVRILDEDRCKRVKWDEFVQKHPEGSFFHLAGWKNIIESVYRQPAYYLYVEQGDEIQGVLPLGHVKSRLFSNALISIPFYVQGGILANSAEAFDALKSHAMNLAKELKVEYLELRNVNAQIGKQDTKWKTKDGLYFRFRKELDSDVEQNLKNIPRKQRAMVRKGISAGLESAYEDVVDEFYESYARSLKQLGTPAFSRSLFHALRSEFGEACDIMTVRKDGELVASVMSFYFRDEVLPYYAGTSDKARGLKAHDFMYWELMRRSVERGYRWFDYGRSKAGTGSFSFKKNWGFEPEPMQYEYYLVGADDIPNISPTNPKYSLFISMWQKMPLWATKVIGPHIVRNIG